ncbi:hydroxyisourate hydrolase [Cognatishimia sp. SS12]|uniref:hydroxyisourate hydrolase n=1 Tax=Cognatishimia sp. SS12 TaxID=2979465 RepID=UPI00232B30D8|nr:hydroxyisourate hydrolase [Cognatishimia sp. SS12]MDC0736751.1 hydroxyisourate hydrolase [Cognatishimia sp. SS12]
MSGYITTHVLDTARGCPAEGVKVELYRLDEGARHLIGEATTNTDGRTDAPILPEDEFATGQYELVFYCGRYFQGSGQAARLPMFLDEVPVRFGINESTHYHVPLLVSPYGYSTYRGS